MKIGDAELSSNKFILKLGYLVSSIFCTLLNFSILVTCTQKVTSNCSLDLSKRLKFKIVKLLSIKEIRVSKSGKSVPEALKVKNKLVSLLSSIVFYLLNKCLTIIIKMKIAKEMIVISFC